MGSGPLIVGLGGAGVSIVSGTGADHLLVDTDVATKDRYPDGRVLIIGEGILRGEGAGRNLKLGMIAFRSGIEQIAKEVSGRFPIFIVAGSEGGTGLAGAVEMNSFLNRSGIPRFTFLISEEGHGADPSRENMALALLAGPLHPGLFVPGEKASSLAKVLTLFSNTSSPTPGIRLPTDAWSRIGSVKGAYELEVIEMTIDDVATIGEGPGPSSRGLCLAAVEAPAALTATDIKKVIEYIFGNTEMMGVGILETMADRITIASISQPINPGPLPPSTASIDISEILGRDDIEPGRGADMLR